MLKRLTLGFSAVFAALYLLSIASAYAASPLFAEDLSILFPPLASPAEAGLLISASSAISHGVVLPLTLFDRLPQLTFTIPEIAIYGDLRVVGARLDPCFPGVDAPSVPTTDCHPQLRLILQPLKLDGDPASMDPPNGQAEEDTAIHLFYDLSNSQWHGLVSAIGALRVRYALTDAGDPWALGVHQGLLKKGLASPYARELIGLLLGALDQRNIERVTFFLLRGRHSWELGGYLVNGSNLTPMPIGTIPNTPANPDEKNAVVQTVSRFAGMNASVTPLPPMSDNMGFFTSEPQAGQESEVKAALTIVNRIENPHIHSPATMDCFSCHTAEGARLYSLQIFGNSVAQPAQAYVATVHSSLPVVSPVETAHFRMFGYQDGQPQIMQRVVNETDLIMKSLSGSSR